jgi:hypothetical protein
VITIVFGVLAGALAGVVLAALVRQLVQPRVGSSVRFFCAIYSTLAIVGSASVGGAGGFFYLLGDHFHRSIDASQERLGDSGPDAARTAIIDAVGDHQWLAQLKDTAPVKRLAQLGAAEAARAALERGDPGASQSAHLAVAGAVRGHVFELVAAWVGVLVVLAAILFWLSAAERRAPAGEPSA